ncbi:MAG: preprotein translocase subunit SecE [Candidatus Saccharibacteria bacterium]
MAEQPIKKKRVVKNPETFRERALKTATQNEQPKRVTQLRRTASRPVGRLLRPIGQAFAKLFRHQPFKFIGQALRLIGRIIFPEYLRGSWRELRRVKWPDWNESRRLTVAVLIFAIVFGGLVSIVDYGLDKIFKQVLLK